MKRARGFFILATVACLALSTVAFGADPVPTKPAIDISATQAPETKATEKAKEKTYGPLGVTEKAYINDRNEDLGFYPVIDGMDDLNTKIYEKIFKWYLGIGNTPNDPFTANEYLLSYTVEDGEGKSRYAVITLKRAYDWKYTDVHDNDDTMKYYVDKEKSTEMTEAEYTEAMKAPEKAPATDVAAAEKEKADMALAELMSTPIPIKVLDDLGFVTKVEQEAGKTVVNIKKDTYMTNVTVGVNQYTVDGASITLETAPLADGDIICVPASFFSKVLKADVKVTADQFDATLDGKTVTVKIVKKTDTPTPAKPQGPEEMGLFPLRQVATELGFEIKFDAATSSISVSKGDFSVKFVTGKNAYTVGDKVIELESEPVNYEGATYVPMSFFEKILGATATKHDDGSFDFSIQEPAVEAPAAQTPAAQ